MSSDPTIVRADHVLQTPSDPVPFTPRPHPRGSGEYVAIREGYRVHELDGLTIGVRRHRFANLASFAEWLRREAGSRIDEVEILIDPMSHLAEATLSRTDPEPDRVTCDFPLDPAWETWLAATARGVSHSQDALYQLVVAFAETLGENAEVFAASLLSVRLATGGDFKLDLDPLGYATVRGQTSTAAITANIPPMIKVTTRIYEDLPTTYTLPILIRVWHDDKQVSFTLSAPTLMSVLRQATADLRDELLMQLGDGPWLVGMGKLARAVVPLVRMEVPLPKRNGDV